MNLIEGVKIQGFNYSGRKDFGFFPGLICWLDPRVGITGYPVPNQARVKTAVERSEWGFTWNDQVGSAGISKGTVATPINPMYVLSAPAVTQNGMQVSPNLYANKWNCITDGSPFTIYHIVQQFSGSTGASNQNSIIREANAKYILVMRVQAGASQGTLRFAVLADDLSTVILTATTPINSLNFNNWSVLEVNHRGYATSGPQLDVYIDDVLKKQASWTAAPGTNNVLQPEMFVATMLGGANHGITLIYNHTGKTQTVINNERSEIRSLITSLFNI